MYRIPNEINKNFKLNNVVITNSLNTLYGLIIKDLIYDSDININFFNDKSYSNSQSQSQSYSSSEENDDYLYFNLLKSKNELEQLCFGKSQIIFLLTDNDNNTFGFYFPEKITNKENYCLELSLFLMTKGIEIINEKYFMNGIFNYLKFEKNSNDLLSIYQNKDNTNGKDQMLFKISKSDNKFKFTFNDKQKSIISYNRSIIKTKEIKRLTIYKCIDKRFNHLYANRNVNLNDMIIKNYICSDDYSDIYNEESTNQSYTIVKRSPISNFDYDIYSINESVENNNNDNENVSNKRFGKCKRLSCFNIL